MNIDIKDVDYSMKKRTKPIELMLFELLHTRLDLSQEDKQHYINLKKGYEGELRFDSFVEKLNCSCIVLNDLLFEVNNTTFQIDSLIIMQGKIILYEVKHFEGDYYYHSDNVYKKPNFEIVNPLNQLSRTESLFRQLLRKLKGNLNVDCFVIFTNPTFTLYQAPLDKPFIFPTQISQHFEKLSSIQTKLTERDRRIADQLLSLHVTESRFSRIPSYEYEELGKGIVCGRCNSFLENIANKKCRCFRCGYEESIETAVLRSIQEFKLLFPDEKITTSKIFEWCKIVKSERRIRKILSSNFIKVGQHRWSYYELK